MGEGLPSNVRSPINKLIMRNKGSSYSIFDIESWGDDAALVDSTQKLNDNFATSVVINQLEFSNVI